MSKLTQRVNRLEAKRMRYKPVRIFDIENQLPDQELAIEAARKEGHKIIFVVPAENELSVY